MTLSVASTIWAIVFFVVSLLLISSMTVMSKEIKITFAKVSFAAAFNCSESSEMPSVVDKTDTNNAVVQVTKNATEMKITA
jgi:hypothetical protein